MPNQDLRRHEHLALPRAEIEPERKRRRGFGLVPGKPFQSHGRSLNQQIESTLQQFQLRSQARPRGIDPNLLLRVNLERPGIVPEEEWARSGLVLVSEDRDGATVLLASEPELHDFRRKLGEYQRGPRADRQNAPHAALFNAIKQVREYGPEDRKGRLLREIEIETVQTYVLDLELWHAGDRESCRRTLGQIEEFIGNNGGRVTDRYIGNSVCLVRVICPGSLIHHLLQLEAVAMVDLPPKPTLTVAEVLQPTIVDFPPISRPPGEAPRLCVIDSGIASGHPMLAPALGEIVAIPASLGSPVDDHGHGTRVAGISLYHDIGECIRLRQFSPHLWILSAKVTDVEVGPTGERNQKFPDEKLISSQMREAIEYFHREHRCRIFNISLGDERLVYSGGKPSIWAWTLDDLARTLDVIIVVPSGNFWPRYDHNDPTNPAYPGYLLHPENRIIEPATAAIVLTVSSLAQSAAPHGAGSTPDVTLRAIAPEDSPSPFSRTGWGIGDSLKPDLCEYGGNLVYWHGANAMQPSNPGVEIVSLNHNHVAGRLFAWDKGTSLAAPKVAHLAARILSSYPTATANLIRAFIASSATIPENAENLLSPLGNDACLRICGYGKPDTDLALYSFDQKVTLFAENELPGDRFHVYEIPLPDVFRTTRGKRKISVTLAFDPPTRHTRKDYLGFAMKSWLIRGKTLPEVVNIFRKQEPGEETVPGISNTSYECVLKPKHRLRERGTLQKGVFEFSQNPKDDYGDTYYLVIQCKKNWTDEEKQRYAVVVVIEHFGQNIDLYATIQQRIAARARVRVRR